MRPVRGQAVERVASFVAAGKLWRAPCLGLHQCRVRADQGGEVSGNERPRGRGIGVGRGGRPRVRWQERAACRGMDPSVFITHKGESTAPAKAVCARCPVTEECWEWSVQISAKHGIWGGMSEKERRARRKREGIVLPPYIPVDLRPIQRDTGSSNAERQERYRARRAAAMPMPEGCPCGTYAGAVRHLEAGERLDPPCATRSRPC